MDNKLLLLSLCFAAGTAYADEIEWSTNTRAGSMAPQQEMERVTSAVQRDDAQTIATPAPAPTANEGTKKKHHFTIGGYGEAVYSYNMYSDNVNRYNSPATYKDGHHGKADVPHVCLWGSYDFGKGWSLNMEIEFEHGGTESAVEMEVEEGGEYEDEIESGGEVALEQFYLQKIIFRWLNVRLGHMVVPVGGTNTAHDPVNFFGVYRPEGENTIIPCTWHETGLTLWGFIDKKRKLRYEAMVMGGLDSDRFSSEGWAADGNDSPYEFTIANSVAGALRLDYYALPGVRFSISGYAGNSFCNTMQQNTSSTYDGVKGTVLIGSFDYLVNRNNWISRGYLTYGHLSDSYEITRRNSYMRSSSPSPREQVASKAIALGAEVGYDFFSFSDKLHADEQKFYVFGRYDYYDSMLDTDSRVTRYEYYGRHRVAFGVNYYPLPEIVIKGEYAIGLLKSQYNNEPAINISVAYCGVFL